MKTKRATETRRNFELMPAMMRSENTNSQANRALNASISLIKQAYGSIDQNHWRDERIFKSTPAQSEKPKGNIA